MRTLEAAKVSPAFDVNMNNMLLTHHIHSNREPPMICDECPIYSVFQIDVIALTEFHVKRLTNLQREE